MYAFVRVKTDEIPDFDDQTFALDLLEQKHVLLAPGTSFNVPYRDHFRTTLLPDAALLKKCSRASKICSPRTRRARPATNRWYRRRRASNSR
jgi:alanine-synthesizing transaminase